MFILVSTVLALLPSAVVLLCLSKWKLLSQLHDNQDSLNIRRQPYDLNTSDILTVIALLSFKSLKSAVGYGPRVTVKPPPNMSARSGAHNGGSAGHIVLPDLSVVMPLNLRPKDIELYTDAATSQGTVLLRTVGTSNMASFVANNTAHLALFLSAVTEPALLLLLARSRCPINPLGAVNVRNHFRVLDLFQCKQLIEQLSCSDSDSNKGEVSDRLASVSIHARLHDARKVNRGVEFDIRVSIETTRNDGSTSPIFYQIFTALEMGRSQSTPSKVSPSASKSSRTQPTGGSEASTSTTRGPTSGMRQSLELVSLIRLRSNDPLVWARLCKDYNPIHTSLLAARLFGFKSKIAHGNHVVAKAVDVLSQAGDMGFTRFCRGQVAGPLWMTVSFRRPVLLPNEMGTRFVDPTPQHHSNDEIQQLSAIEIFRGDKVHVECSVGFTD